ncbi:helix-turn-helix domain-containing protein [Streptomyces sp. NPDC050400]|uniref:AraC-like ligand-binding domain-containing protein n=1 Tax=Streptomyces sp. NPDC050400 TaxID=3365610 RepID=UPI0037A4D69D
MAVEERRPGGAAGPLSLRDTTASVLQSAASGLLAPLTVTAPPGPGFRAHIDGAVLGAYPVARVRGSAHRVAREPRAISSTDAELVKLTLHRSAPAVAAQGRAEARLAPGVLTLLDMNRPYRLTVADHCDVVAVGVPRTVLAGHGRALSAHLARALPADSGTRAVLATYLDGVAGQLGTLPGAAHPYLADALGALLVAALTERPPGRIETPTDLVDRIRAYAVARIADPGLCVEQAAHAHGISARHLHRLFKAAGTPFAAWLRAERLDRLHRDLLDPALAGRTTAALAARWGLRDPRHIGRAFRARYGVTARELRPAPPPGR